MLNILLFILLALIHIFIWLFIVFAFLYKPFIKINIYIIIPLIYLIHIFPIHILEELKKKTITEENHRNKLIDKINKILIIPDLHDKLNRFFLKNCFQSPLSPQGLLIFGLISSIYTLYPY